MSARRICILTWSIAFFAIAFARADDIRLHYDRSGNIVAIQKAAATTLAIEDVRPGVGVAGSSVTIVGGGFAETPSANSVSFNGTAAVVVAASTSALSVVVPAGAASGLVSVTAGGTTAQSPHDFIILPSAISPASVAEATAITLDGGPLDVATAGPRSAAVSFRLMQGAYATFQFLAISGASTSSVPYAVYKPDGTSFASGTVGSGMPSLLLPRAPATGVYTLFLSPPGWLKTRLALASDPVLQTDGPSLVLASAQPHQLRRAWFSGTAGQNLSYAYTNLLTTPTSAGAPRFAFYKSDGSVLSSLINLPTTGDYSVIVTPDDAASKTNLNLWLSSEITGMLPFNMPTALSVSRPGQHARYTFSGTQGQQLRLATGSTTTNPINQRVGVSIYNPNGSRLVDTDIAVAGTNYAYAIPALPATGTYTVFVGIDTYGDDQNATWGTTLTLSTGISATISVDGPPTSISTTLPGQEVRATFTATAGQNLGFAYTNLSLTPTNAGIPRFTTYKPDGTPLSSWTNLPATGTYTMYITPDADTTASSMQLWLSSDITGTMPIDAPTALSVSRPGQHARYTFSGSTGQRFRLGTTATTTNPADQRVGISFYKPSGGRFVDTDLAVPGSNYTYSIPVLSETGTYTMFVGIAPYGDNQNSTWGTTLTLSADPQTTIAVDGPATAVSTNLHGQEVQATFAGTAGQNLGFAYTNLSVTPTNAGIPRFTTYKPDGTVLSSWTNLPATGTYTMYITPDADTTASSMQVWLSSDAVGALSLGTPAALSVNRPGQRGRYTLQGTQGQIIKFTGSSTSTVPADQRVLLYLYGPSGSVLINGVNFTAGGSQTYSSPVLPSTGAYVVLLQVNAYDNPNSTWATTLTATPQ